MCIAEQKWELFKVVSSMSQSNSVQSKDFRGKIWNIGVDSRKDVQALGVQHRGSRYASWSSRCSPNTFKSPSPLK